MSIYDKLMNQDPLQQVKRDPISMGKAKGYNIPENIANNPQAMVMHLIQTGQVGGPLLQRVLPMIRSMK